MENRILHRAHCSAQEVHSKGQVQTLCLNQAGPEIFSMVTAANYLGVVIERCPECFNQPRPSKDTLECLVIG